jgi:hypothetical protein
VSVLGSLRDLVREMLSPDASDEAPPWAPWVPWEYQVAEATETTFSGRATSSRCPWPDLVGIPLMPGVPGTLLQPAVGSLVLVAFVNGDPSRPRVVSWDQTVPVSVGLAGGGPAVHRVGDAGSAGSLEGSGNTIVVKNPVGDPVGLLTFASSSAITVTGVAPLETLATSGSSKVTSG